MDTDSKTVVTFKSSAFNSSEQKSYFINAGCFGDDVAKWLAEQLSAKGYPAAEVPGQEDFGWYFTFVLSGIEYCFVIGYRPGVDGLDGVWIGSLERSRGLVASVLGRRKQGIEPAAARVVHEVLSSSPLIGDVRWHFDHEFDSGREKVGTPNRP